MQLSRTKIRKSFILSTKTWIKCFLGKNPVNSREKSGDITDSGTGRGTVLLKTRRRTGLKLQDTVQTARERGRGRERERERASVGAGLAVRRGEGPRPLFAPGQNRRPVLRAPPRPSESPGLLVPVSQSVLVKDICKSSLRRKRE